MWDQLWINARLATMRKDFGSYGTIESGALGIANGRIAFAGAVADLPDLPERLATDVEDADGAWITPGLIDCHTHIVFAGNRAEEFEMRAAGARYEDIHRAGGGIQSTVRATRAASERELADQSRPRIESLMSGGVTTIEIKSGYGLDLENELKMLRVARALGKELGARVKTTLLGAHALPPEFANARGGYIDQVCTQMIPAAAREKLADAVDAFCEGIAFSSAEVAQVFEAAARHDMRVKLHADQLTDCGGAALAARFGALSADHLEFASEEGLAAMAKAGTVGVLLPGAFLMTREKQLPPVEKMRELGVRIAIASDANPGTSPARSLAIMLPLACALFGLTPEEALAGVTREAACALGIAGETGTLETGKSADLCVWHINHPRELAYWLGGMRPYVTYRKGASTPTVLTDST
jgi:imidazolonepropionase